MLVRGRYFYKMTGSGNDFVMIDARDIPPGPLAVPVVIQRICARGTGVGADGIVFLERSAVATVLLTYRNCDGSTASLCGNACLCTTRLAVGLGIAPSSGLAIETGAGVLAARMAGSKPEVDLGAVTEIQDSLPDVPLEQGEHRIGFALAGVPHMVVLCEDVNEIAVVDRGRPLRQHKGLPHGANVNFVSRRPDADWAIRTYERGVETETLACGTGAVAAAVLLNQWGQSGLETRIWTRSGRDLRIRSKRTGTGWLPSLSGDARIVYEGILGEYDS